MARPKKYATEEERKEAHREACRKHRRKVSKARSAGFNYGSEEERAAAFAWNLDNRRRSAKQHGREFTITMDDLRPIPETCPILDIPLKLHRGKLSDDTATIDRIDSRRGYVPGNVIILSWRANRLKNNGNAQEHLAIARFLLSRYSTDVSS